MEAKKYGYSTVRKVVDELMAVMPETIHELAICYDQGRKKYPKDDWLIRPVEHHLEHIEAHIVEYKKDVNSAENRFNLIHSALRILMIHFRFHNRDQNLFTREYFIDESPKHEDEFQF